MRIWYYAIVTIGAWCVTLQVSLLRSNMIAASRTLHKKYASCVSPNKVYRRRLNPKEGSKLGFDIMA